MAQANAAGALRAGGKKHLRRGGMRIFLEEMVLDFPDVVDPQFIREFDLRDGILDQAALGILMPWLRQLMFVE